MIRGTKCALVAEIGINHNGKMDYVHRMIKMASLAGFHFVKFQKRNVEVTTPCDRWEEPKDTPWGRITYLDYKKKLELGSVHYNAIETWCQEEGLQWYASPWDADSVRFLEAYQVPYIKVASAGNTDMELLAEVRDVGLPVILSTGMTDKAQFDRVIEMLHGQVEYILACTSTYPSRPEEINLSFIRNLKQQYPWARIGFSNHNPGVLFAASSVLYGAEMVEVHITLDRAMWGSDQAASIEMEGMCKLQKYVSSLEMGIGDGEWVVYDSEIPIARNLRWKDF